MPKKEPRPKRWDQAWNKMDRKDQDLYLTLLWKDGYSEKAIADFFKTTKNTAVRRRHSLALENKGRGTIKYEVTYSRFHDLLDIEEMDKLVEQNDNVVCLTPVGPLPEQKPDTEPLEEKDLCGVLSPERPKYQMTANWQLQCTRRDEQGHQCSFIKEPGSDRCKLHHH